MSDELEQNEIVEEEVEDTPAEAEKPDTEDESPKVRTVPYSRFKSVNDEKKALEEKLEAGDPQQLSEALEAAEAIIEKQVEALKENLPDEQKDLLARIPVIDQLEWLVENGKAFRPSGVPKTPNGDKPGKLSEEDKRKQAARTF